MSSHIEILIYSYRNKNLNDVVSNLYRSFIDNDFTVTVVDQNNVDRGSFFDKFPNMSYVFRRWDSLRSPCEKKMNFISEATAEYTMIMSDDIVLQDGWRELLIGFLADKEDVVVSGHTVANLIQKDLFSIFNNPIWDNKFSLSQFIDRNFIFGKTSDLQKAVYPGELKYHGEEELYSINLLAAGVDIYSAPGELYLDTNARTLENLYVPFSRYHNYNKFYEYVQHDISSKFLEYHNLDRTSIRLLPDFNNDVSYLYTDLDFVSLGGNKFIEVPNKIS